ncbi:MAG: tyrosine--tRNA ligase [bacterium]|nr:tyrosine--tRNA ligase [bacterium]
MFWNKNETKVITDENKIDELLLRGVAEIIDKEKLASNLKSGKPLRVKFGIDPTSPNLHLGRAVVLWKLRAFQELGHKIIFIIGDFTGVIGDTSDKDSERPMLSDKIIRENLKEYFNQAGKILEMNTVEKYYNSEWLAKLTYKEIGEQADRFSVADFIARENIERRLSAGTRVSLREILYPLMQGYDSVKVESNVEIGGTDQRFNMLSGRTLQEFYKQKPQQILMTKLLRGIDGRKMSSSWGNTINIVDSPNDMYGKAMRLNDELISEFFLLATNIKEEEIAEITNGLKNGTTLPKDAKMRLAQELVRIYHGPTMAQKAQEQFVNTFSKKEAPEEALTVEIKEGELLGDVLLRTRIVDSKSEFSRLILAGAVEIVGGPKITNGKAPALSDKTYKIGKHRFLKTK